MQTAADLQRERIKKSLRKAHDKAQSKRYDVSGYPADVQDIIERVCELWNIKPPRTKKSKSYWIQSARELQDATGEFGLKAIDAYHEKFMERIQENMRKGKGGVAPHIVEGPGSLIKSVRATAAEMRQGCPECGAIAGHARGCRMKFIEYVQDA